MWFIEVRTHLKIQKKKENNLPAMNPILYDTDHLIVARKLFQRASVVQASHLTTIQCEEGPPPKFEKIGLFQSDF